MRTALKVFCGWCAVTATYLLVCLVFFQFVTLDSSRGLTNLQRSPELKPVLGALLILVPYAVAGWYSRGAFAAGTLQGAVLVSVVPNVGEKLGIYLLTACVYGLDPLAVNEIMARTTTGDQVAPFFTYGYVALSLLVGSALGIGLAAWGGRSVLARHGLV
ncbi:MAG: hypothetical protein ACYC4R_15865 [Anaerolineae bacterium]